LSASSPPDEQDLEELEDDIWNRFVESCTWGTYSPMSDEAHLSAGYTRITRHKAKKLAILSGYEEISGEYILNLKDASGCIQTGYEDRVIATNREQAITDYLY